MVKYFPTMSLHRIHWLNTLATGFAMFSMFFGAGNVVFPLALGQHAQDQNFFAVSGLLLTGVGVPFLGLMAMTLYDGDYKQFFSRLGPKVGFLLALIIMGLIGPLGALPRCIALSFSTTHLFIPSLSPVWFSLIACLIIFLCTAWPSRIIDILGYALTPFLLASLAIIVIRGIWTAPVAPISALPSMDAFLDGLKEGYQTMDLLGAFFFSSVIILGIKQEIASKKSLDVTINGSSTLHSMKQAICVGAFLLSAVYIGFSFVASFHSEFLATIAKDKLLGHIAIEMLGPYGGIIACGAVALACLTTAIALAAVSAEYIQHEVGRGRLGYTSSLLITLGISFVVSTMNFTAIIEMLAPVLEVCYPALIALTCFNLAHKLWNIQVVKWPVFAVFFLSLGIKLFL